MSISTKSQFYQHTMKLAGLFTQGLCSNRAVLYIRPPEDALSIEGLYCRLRITFDASIAVGDRIVKTVGVCNAPRRILPTPTYVREFTLNQAADGSRVVDLQLDLTTLLKRDNVKFAHAFDDFDTLDFTMVFFTLPDNLYLNPNTGTIDIWKLDAMFTTKEIR